MRKLCPKDQNKWIRMHSAPVLNKTYKSKCKLVLISHLILCSFKLISCTLKFLISHLREFYQVILNCEKDVFVIQYIKVFYIYLNRFYQVILNCEKDVFAIQYIKVFYIYLNRFYQVILNCEKDDFVIQHIKVFYIYLNNLKKCRHIDIFSLEASRPRWFQKKIAMSSKYGICI